MRAMTNARASLNDLVDGSVLLQQSMQAAEGASQETTSGLEVVRSKLEAARSEIDLAVTDLTTSDVSGDKAARRSSAKAAKTRLDVAETAKAEAGRQLAALSKAKTGDPSAGPAISAAAGMLVDAERAAASARVAVKQSERLATPFSTRMTHTFFIVAVPVILVGLWQLFAKPDPNLLGSAVFAWVVVGVVLLFVTFRDAENGVIGPVIGVDKRLSTSKVQIAIWSIVVGFGISFLVGRVMWMGVDIETALPPELLDDYLILLGGPFAAGVLAKLTTTQKVENGTLQKTEAAETTAGQIFRDDAGNADLIDSQYVMFNLIALGYFLVQLAMTATLPVIPMVLLGLTSAAALTYTANKAVERNAPIITSVSPKSCLPGQRIRVTGLNFYAGVEDPATARVAVLIEGHPGELRPAPGSLKTELTIDLPLALTTGTKALTVRTAANVESAAYWIDVVDNLPILFGLSAPAEPGKPATIVGGNLLSPGSGESEETVAVSIGGLAVVGTAHEAEVLFTVPESLTPGTDVALTVSRGTSTSAPITVHLKN